MESGFAEAARVVRWDSRKPPDESAIRIRFAADSLEPHRWSNEAFVAYSDHRHSYTKVLYVVRGSITFTLTDQGRAIDLQPGDRLELPPNTNHTALVGPNGVVCLEAARE